MILKWLVSTEENNITRNSNIFLYSFSFFIHIIIGDDMEKRLYEKIVMNHRPKEHRLRNAITAFIVGGIVGVIGEGLLELYTYYLNVSSSDAAVFMMVTLIFLASLFTALGFFDKWVNFARCGLIIPITGFAHSIMSAGLEFKREGFVYGIGSNVFKLAGSVLFYGISIACLVGIIRYIGGF